MLGKLFSICVPTLNGCVPLDIAHSAFKAASAMVLGHFSKEENYHAEDNKAIHYSSL